MCITKGFEETSQSYLSIYLQQTTCVWASAFNLIIEICIITYYCSITNGHHNKYIEMKNQKTNGW